MLVSTDIGRRVVGRRFSAVPGSADRPARRRRDPPAHQLAGRRRLRRPGDRAALERHKAKVVAHIDGLAASAATAIAVAADEVLMAAGAMFMIHNAWTIAIGDKNDFLECAALLEKVDGTLADRYAAHTGKPVSELKTLMDAETWFTAEEAVEFGFASAVEGDEKSDAKASKPRRSGTCARSKGARSRLGAEPVRGRAHARGSRAPRATRLRSQPEAA
jgi:enoyl-CoA hydratase/carnithine racemase